MTRPTRVVGALVLLAGAVALSATRLTAQNPRPASNVTYSKDVAPIVFAKCAMCHHPGGSGPFSVLNYQSARAQASQMVMAVRSGYMPPWRADPTFGGPFIGQSHLTEAEKNVLDAWVMAGAPEGNARDLPPRPAYADGWQLGTPDLIVKPPIYTLTPDGTDVFRVFVIPLPVNGLRYVRALEFRPGNTRVVHHANIRIDETTASRRFDDADPLPGYEGLIAHSAVYPDGHFLGWTPGQVAPLLPKGLAWRLKPQTDLVVEVHMQPDGREELVQPSIGLYFGSDPPDTVPTMLRLGRQGIDIPPGEANYKISDSYVLPVDVDVLAIQPHAHQRAKQVVGMAILPDGTAKPLLRIANWDFRWQHVFRLVTPLALPKGTTLTMNYVYDNSADNPRNPVLPPRRVFWGQRSGDEMGDLWIQVLTHNDRDLVTLADEFNHKVMTEDVIGYERWVESEPKSAALRDDLGSLYLKLNRPNEAVRHFAISAGLQPSAQASFNLATALTVAGQVTAAVQQYEHALELRPDYAAAHTNLGSLLLQQGRSDLALVHLREALRLDPSSIQAHFSIGIALEQSGQWEEAIAHLRRVLEVQGDLPEALSNLAWMLAVAADDRLRNPTEAARLAERAAALTGGRDPVALDVLAAAHASGGAFDRAVATANAALALNPPNATDITARRDLYASRRPYRQRQ